MSSFPPLPLGEVLLLPQNLWLWVERAGEDAPAAASLALSPQEEACWQALKHPRRRMEWKQGRLMAKGLVAKALGGAPEAFELLPREAGPPQLLCEGKALGAGWLSVSHTALYVGVAFAPFAVGLDICDRADARRIERIARRAFVEEELALASVPEGLAALWALKEAALKRQGGGVFRPGLLAIQIISLFPPVLRFPNAEVCLYALPEAFVAIAK